MHIDSARGVWSPKSSRQSFSDIRLRRDLKDQGPQQRQRIRAGFEDQRISSNPQRIGSGGSCSPSELARRTKGKRSLNKLSEYRKLSADLEEVDVEAAESFDLSGLSAFRSFATFRTIKCEASAIACKLDGEIFKPVIALRRPWKRIYSIQFNGKVCRWRLIGTPR